ncbi:unnamed protein product [Sphacelaria rigidula]
MQAELVEKKHARLQGQRAKETSAALTGRLTSSARGHAEQLLEVQVASFAELDELTRENHATLEEVKILLREPAGGNFLPDDVLTDAEKLQELDRLVAMAKALGEVASRHTEEEDTRWKMMALDPGSKAYYTAVRRGLCNAYLAASVVDSGLVSTSEIGVMGKAGTALKLISSAVPVIGGLASLAGAALKVGDCYLQTQRVVKITDLAPDAVECSKLTKMLALRLTDALVDITVATSHGWREGVRYRAWTVCCISRVSGGFESSEGYGTLPDGASEEAVMEWFIENVVNCVSSKCGTTRLGKRHLHTLLEAVGRDCLQGINSIEGKVERLVKVVIPEAGTSPTATSSAPERSSVRFPVSASPHDGILDREVDFSAMKAELEALKLADESLQREFEALKSEKQKLQSRVVAMEKRISKPQAESGDSVDAGGGQLLAQKQKTKTKTMEEFNQEMENPDLATDRQTDNPDEPWVTLADREMVEGEMKYLDERVSALEKENRGKKGFLSRWRRHR